MKSFILLIMCFFMLSLSARDIFLTATLMTNISDQVKFVLPRRALKINQVSKVEKLQPFSLHAVLGLKSPTAEPLKLQGELTVIDPRGKIYKVLKDIPLFDQPAGSRGVFISRSTIRVSFDPPDPLGEYTFSLKINGFKGEKPSVFSKKITLVPSITDFKMMEFKEFDQLYATYHTNPRPERLLAALNYCLSEGISEMRRKQRRFNPAYLLHWFVTVFKNNPQFYDELAKMSGSKPPKDQYFALLFSGIGEENYRNVKNQINPHVLKQIEGFKSGYPLKKSTFPDKYWAEFYAGGNFAPVAELCRMLRQQPALYPKDAKAIIDSGRALTADERQKLFNAAQQIAVFHTLKNSVAKNQILLKYYLETILVRKLYSDKQAGSLLLSILQSSKNPTPRK